MGRSSASEQALLLLSAAVRLHASPADETYAAVLTVELRPLSVHRLRLHRLAFLQAMYRHEVSPHVSNGPSGWITFPAKVAGENHSLGRLRHWSWLLT